MCFPALVPCCISLQVICKMLGLLGRRLSSQCDLFLFLVPVPSNAESREEKKNPCFQVQATSRDARAYAGQEAEYVATVPDQRHKKEGMRTWLFYFKSAESNSFLPNCLDAGWFSDRT